MEYKTLYIIGNGFDIHHGIPSSYRNYLDWLRIHNQDTYNKIVSLYGDRATSIEWWNEFEKNLGFFPIRENIDDISWRNQPSEDDLEKLRSIDFSGGAWEAQNTIGATIQKIKSSFHNWVDSLPNAKFGTKLKIGIKESFFINFNYTLTLEKVYGVNRNNILYIHGSLNTDDYIIGHGRSRKEIEDEANSTFDNIQEEDDSSYYEDPITEETKTEVIDIAMEISKPVNDIINRNRVLFEKFTKVGKVYILGLSLSDVDLQYLETIIKIVPKDTVFIISCYSSVDHQRAMKIKEKYNINCSFVKLEDFLLQNQLTIDFDD